MVINELVSFFTLENIHPRRIITNYSHICCVECAVFLSALSKPAAVSLFVLPPTICLVFSKCHSTVSIFAHGFIVLPFPMQNISLAVMWPSNNDLIQNQVSSAKKLYFEARFLLIIFSCRVLQFKNQFRISKSCVCLSNAFSGLCGLSCPLQISTTPFQCVQRSQM
jgi:hypothetical protein